MSFELITSLPMRERGLKFPTLKKKGIGTAVAPHAGAWIEITAS